MKLKAHYCNNYNFYFVVITLLFLFIVTSCAGSRSQISAPSVNYPVSLSSAIRNVDGTIPAVEDLAKVGEFNYQYKTRSMLWTLIPLSRQKHDISNALNEQIAKAGGDAVINLAIKNGGDPVISFTSMLTLGLLPTSSLIEIKGDIVSRKTVSK